MMNIDQCYTILELSRNATSIYLKANYRRLVLKYHPDKNNGNDRQFKLIQEAYETLSKHLQTQLAQPSPTIYSGDFLYPSATGTHSTWTFTFSG